MQNRTGCRAGTFDLPSLHPHGTARHRSISLPGNSLCTDDTSPPLPVLARSAPPGKQAAPKYLVTIAEGLTDRGHNVTIRTASTPGVPRDEVVRGVIITPGAWWAIQRVPAGLLSQLTGRQRADVVVDVQNGVPPSAPLPGHARSSTSSTMS